MHAFYDSKRAHLAAVSMARMAAPRGLCLDTVAVVADILDCNDGAARQFFGWLAPDFRSAQPVMIVGNLTVGGAGKTPVVIALVEALRKQGFRPGVISRGYGARIKAPRAVTLN